MWNLFWRRSARNKKSDDAFNESVQKLFGEELKSLHVLAFLLTA